MAHVSGDRCLETTTSTGTGNITVLGAVAGHRTLASVMTGDGDTADATIAAGAEWEIVTITRVSATVFSRAATPVASSNAGSAVSFSAGTKEIWLDTPSSKLVPYDRAITLTDAQKLQTLANIGSLHLNCGRLTYVSATAIKFAPFNGDLIKIQGSLYRIPAAGIAGVANTSVFVGGVAAQNLAANTVYLVCAFINAGVVTADFRSSVGRATSTTAGNIGTEVSTSAGEPRTVIGMIRTNASSQFVDSATQRFVISWFNRRSIDVLRAVTSSRTTTSAAWVELNTADRVEFITWAEESIPISLFATGNNSSANGVFYAAAGLDSITPTVDAYHCILGATAAGSAASIGNTANRAVTEGYHYFAFLGGASAGTSTYDAARHGTSTMIRG